MGNCVGGSADYTAAPQESNPQPKSNQNGGGGGGSGGTNASSGSGMGATKKNMPIGPVLNRPMDEVKTCYTIGKELGRGQFGVTYLCTEKSTGKK